MELSWRSQTAVQIVSKPPAPSNETLIYRFLGKLAMRTHWMAGHADPLDGWLVHLRCAVIHLAQYTDTWTCHLHKESRLTTHTDITPHHSSRPCSKPLPTPHLHLRNPNTRPTLPCPHRIGRAQTQSTHLLTPFLLRGPEPNTYTFHTPHQLLSSHAPH